jgi:hypothetical protein
MFGVQPLDPITYHLCTVGDRGERRARHQRPGAACDARRSDWAVRSEQRAGAIQWAA